MNTQAQKKILQFIRFGPVIGILLFSFAITFTLITDQYEHLQDDLDNIQTKLIEEQKSLIKQEVNRVYDYVLYQRSLAEKKLKVELKNRVYEAYGIIESIYQKNKHQSKEQIISLISQAIRPMRFNDNRGYYYIIGLDSKVKMHALSSELEGDSLGNLVDKAGNFVVQDVILTIKESKEQFNTYFWSKPNEASRSTYKKIVFNKYFEPLDLYVGTGEYVDEFEAVLQKEILDYVSTIRYRGNGYIFINDYSGVNLAHIEKEYRGVNFNEVKDSNGISTVKELNRIAQEKGEGFLTYIGQIEPVTGKKDEKISFVRGFDDWQWSIGTSRYMNEIQRGLEEQRALIQKSNAKQIFVIVTVSLVITVIFMVLSFIFSRRLQDLFLNYNETLARSMQEKQQREEMLFQQRKMAAMGEMLENVSHQWRQPLSVVSTAATGIIVQNEAGLMTNKCLKSAMNEINTTIQYLSETLENFRTYFKVSKHKHVVDLSLLMQKSLSLLKARLEEHEITIDNKLEHENIETYEEQLLQVFVQILNNAIDALEDHQGLKLIKLSMHIQDELITIKITDSGGGVDPKIMDRIFEPYFTSEHQSIGKGIGLYMCQETISKQLNGEITVRNVEFKHEKQKCKGARFTIKIPKPS